MMKTKRILAGIMAVGISFMATMGVHASPPPTETITTAPISTQSNNSYTPDDEQVVTITAPEDIGFDFRALEAAGFTYEEIQTIFELEAIRIVNEVRASYGLQPLTLHSGLARIARLRTEEMVTYNVRGHISPTTGLEHTAHARAMGLNLAYAGENAGRGPRTPQAIIDGWLESPAHREFILSGHSTSRFPDLGHIGIGFSFDERRTAWTLWQTCNNPA